MKTYALVGAHGSQRETRPLEDILEAAIHRPRTSHKFPDNHRRRKDFV